MEAVLRTAAAVRAPVIMMAGPSEFETLEPADMGAVANAMARRFEVRAALHLDHGNSLEMVDACLSAGFTSVMLDFSSRPLGENMEAMKRVVTAARRLNATVEGELGTIGRADQMSVEGQGQSTLTDPGVAASFVKGTEIDALAVSIGNAHGMYTTLPRLDFERLAKIHATVPAYLVLHGGSGTPESDLRRVISLGITKVNVASEIINAMRQSLLSQWGAGSNLWIPVAAAAAIKAMTPVLEKWFYLTGATGRA
jgi:ketose-bisphosphate aldolase